MAQPNMVINLELLIKLMKMTTSSTDGEALAAIRMANSQLAKIGGDWEELLRGKLAPIDPFASLPEPPKAEPPPPRHSSWQTTTSAPPPPPPPPKFYGSDPKEAKNISSWLVVCEFASLDPHITRQIAHIELRWRTNKQLSGADYDLLRQTVARCKRKGP